MASNLGTLAVYLTADTNKFNSALRNAQMSIGKFATVAKIGAVAGAAAISAFAVKSVQAYSESEDAINNFEAALRANGDEVEKTSKRFQKFASDMESLTIFDDEQILNTLTYGRNLGIATDKLQDAGKAAAGLAAKYKIDLQSAMQLVGKAAAGNTGTLSRYGIILDDTLSKEEKFNALLKIGVANFSLAEAQTKTLQGRVKQLSNAWGNLQEAIGGVILQIINVKGGAVDATNAIQKLTEIITRNASKWSIAIQEWIINVKYGFLLIYEVGESFFENMFIKIFSFVDDFKVAFKWVGDNFEDLFFNMDTVAVEALKALGKNLIATLSLPIDIAAGKIKNLFEGIREFDPGKLLNAMTSKDTLSEYFQILGNNIKTGMVNISSKLEIPAPSFNDFSSQYKDIGDVVLGVDDKRLEALKKLYEQPLIAAQKQTQQIEETVSTINSANATPQMKFAGAVEKGTVDAYRAELAGKNTTEEYTKKTADNTEKMYRAQTQANSYLSKFANLGVA